MRSQLVLFFADAAGFTPGRPGGLPHFFLAGVASWRAGKSLEEWEGLNALAEILMPTEVAGPGFLSLAYPSFANAPRSRHWLFRTAIPKTRCQEDLRQDCPEGPAE